MLRHDKAESAGIRGQLADDQIHLVGHAEAIAANLEKFAGGDERLELPLERCPLLAGNAKNLCELSGGCGMVNFVANELKQVHATRITCKSPTFVAVGPVLIKSPSLSKNTYVLLSLRNASGARPAACARSSVDESTIAPAASVGPSMPSVPMLAAATRSPRTPSV